MIDTARVTDRRAVRFNAMAEILADAEELDGGPIITTGNWTAGQILSHIALAINKSIDGFVGRASPEMRERGRSMKAMALKQGFPPGIAPSEELKAQLISDDPVSWEDGLRELRRAIARAESEPMTSEQPFFGPMTHTEWEQFHCRHAELHFSFMRAG